MSDDFCQDDFAQEVTNDQGEQNQWTEQPQSEEQPTEQPEPETETDSEPVDNLRRITSVHGNLTHVNKGRPAARTVGKPRRPQSRMPGKSIAVERPPEVKNFDEEPPERDDDDSAPARPKTSIMKPVGRGMPGMPGGFNPAAVKLKAAAPVEKKAEPAQPAPEFLNSVKLRSVADKPKGGHGSNQTSIPLSQSVPNAGQSGPPKRPPPGPPPGIPGQPPPPIPKGTPPPPIPKGAPPPVPKGAPPPVPKTPPPPAPDGSGPLSPKGNPVSPRGDDKAKACETCGSKFGILGSAKIHCKNCSKYYCKKCCKKGTNPSAGVTKPILYCNACFAEVCPEAQK